MVNNFFVFQTVASRFQKRYNNKIRVSQWLNLYKLTDSVKFVLI
jgi:hypothetical protein